MKKFKIYLRKRLTVEEIISLLRELSDNEKGSGDFLGMYESCDDENFIPVVSPGLGNDVDIEINDSQNQNVFVAHDGLQWKECVCRNAVRI
ncbi:hypothetical protein NPIL_320211 [Nephila pilipes]|uniref:Uncharacterized protein n=1 Tax=Nephila pilipes TaxID=299642 RepID=A0A8X6KNL5_NEPPI|nr:hypothetical protein NPIL_320211 [Nephila pilipes]